MLTNLKFIAFTVLLFSCFANAQTDGKGYANLKGTVIDEQNFPMPGASIIIKINDKTYGSTTDFDGKFLIKRIPSGSHLLKVTFVGYKSYSQEVSLSGGETKSLPIISLIETSNQLADVTVTGQSKGKLKALNVERNADNIIDVVSLEQAEKIPDDNVADVLKRVAGINVVMDQGEARSVSVRGLGPAATNVLVDGERVASTAYAGSREVELDLIPADIIQNIEVSKSISADMDGESNGATIDLITRTALSQKLNVSANLSRSFVTTGDIPGSRVSLNVSRRFFDNKLGLSVNASTSRRNYKSDNIEANWSFQPAGVEGFEDDTRYLREFEIRQYWLSRVRNSFNISADYEFNDHHQIGLKFSSSFRDDYENRYRTRLASLDFPVEYDENNIYVTEGDMRLETTGGQSGGKSNNYRLDYKKTLYGKLKGEHLIGNTEVDWSASYSNFFKHRDRREIEYEAVEGDFEVLIDVTNPSKPSFETFNLTDLYNASLYSLTTWHRNIDGSRKSYRLDIEYPLSFGYIKIGGRLNETDRLEENKTYDYFPTDPQDLNVFGDTTSIFYTREKFYPGEYDLLPVVSRAFLGDLDFDGPRFTKREDLDERFETSYDSNQKVYAGYALAKVEFSDEFYIRAGIRYELSELDYKSYRYDETTGGLKMNNNKRRYITPLPSASLKYKITDDLTLRASFSQTLRRPSHTQLSPNYKFEISSSFNNRIFKGNPSLKPTQTNNYDMSLRYSFGYASRLSIDGFLKQIKNPIFNTITSEYVGLNQYILIESVANAGSGLTSGAEISTKLSLADISRALKNFSIYANTTLNLNSFIKDSRPNTPKRSLGYASKFNYNLSVLYSSDIFEFSTAIHSTSPFVSSYDYTLSYHNPRNDRYYDKQFRIAMNLSCKLDEGLYIFASGANLTNQPLRYYSGSVHYVEQEEFYGPNYGFGVRYRF